MIIPGKGPKLSANDSGCVRALLCATVLPAAICTMGTALLLLVLGPCIALLMKAHEAQQDLPLKLAVSAAIALVALIQVGSCGAGGFLVGRTQRRGCSISKDGRDRARGCLVWALGIFFGVFASLAASHLLPASVTTSAQITTEQDVSSLAGPVVLASISEADCLACSRKDDSASWLGQYIPTVLVQPATAVTAEQKASDRHTDPGSTFGATLAASLIAGFSLSLSCLAACLCAAPGGRARQFPGPGGCA